jgi:hypothetical protein
MRYEKIMVELKKQYLSIYMVYILLGLSLGLWEVFKPIWLIEKGLTIESLGIIFLLL